MTNLKIGQKIAQHFCNFIYKKSKNLQRVIKFEFKK